MALAPAVRRQIRMRLAMLLAELRPECKTTDCFERTTAETALQLSALLRRDRNASFSAHRRRVVKGPLHVLYLRFAALKAALDMCGVQPGNGSPRFHTGKVETLLELLNQLPCTVATRAHRVGMSSGYNHEQGQRLQPPSPEPSPEPEPEPEPEPKAKCIRKRMSFAAQDEVRPYIESAQSRADKQTAAAPALAMADQIIANRGHDAAAGSSIGGEGASLDDGFSGHDGAESHHAIRLAIATVSSDGADGSSGGGAGAAAADGGGSVDRLGQLEQRVDALAQELRQGLGDVAARLTELQEQRREPMT
jgi:hypothetical protein